MGRRGKTREGGERLGMEGWWGHRSWNVDRTSRKWHVYLIFAFRFCLGEIFSLFIQFLNIQNHHLCSWSWFPVLLFLGQVGGCWRHQRPRVFYPLSVCPFLASCLCPHAGVFHCTMDTQVLKHHDWAQRGGSRAVGAVSAESVPSSQEGKDFRRQPSLPRNTHTQRANFS